MHYIAGPSVSALSGYTVLSYNGIAPAKVILQVMNDFGSSDEALCGQAAVVLAQAMSLQGGLPHALTLLRAEAIRQEAEGATPPAAPQPESE